MYYLVGYISVMTQAPKLSCLGIGLVNMNLAHGIQKRTTNPT